MPSWQLKGGDALSRGKKVTQQTLIGEAGIALIHKRVTEMGFLFHPRRVDHGIDGHIDPVDPGTRDVLNLVLLVQSKASSMPFPYEDADGFQYTCEERDLNYWLSGNAPVILVLSHPDQGEAWWVDIKAELSDPKLRAIRTVRVDKHRQVFDATTAPALLRRAVPKNSGLFLASPPKRETLTSNLLRVENLPAVLHIAPAAVTTYPAAGELLARERGADGGGWILRDGLVISFSDLTKAPLRVLCSGDTERHDTAEWSQSSDLDTLHRFMHLLSRTSGPTAAPTYAGTRNAATCASVPHRTWLPGAKGVDQAGQDAQYSAPTTRRPTRRKSAFTGTPRWSLVSGESAAAGIASSPPITASPVTDTRNLPSPTACWPRSSAWTGTRQWQAGPTHGQTT
jgi:Domain of unknown function (DUF4365)